MKQPRCCPPSSQPEEEVAGPRSGDPSPARTFPQAALVPWSPTTVRVAELYPPWVEQMLVQLPPGGERYQQWPSYQLPEQSPGEEPVTVSRTLPPSERFLIVIVAVDPAVPETMKAKVLPETAVGVAGVPGTNLIHAPPFFRYQTIGDPESVTVEISRLITLMLEKVWAADVALKSAQSIGAGMKSVPLRMQRTF